jgi:hypothetical protein
MLMAVVAEAKTIGSRPDPVERMLRPVDADLTMFRTLLPTIPQ